MKLPRFKSTKDIILPLLDKDPTTVAQMMWQYGRPHASTRTKFVQHLRVSAFHHAQGTGAMDELLTSCDGDLDKVMRKIEKALLGYIETVRSQTGLLNSFREDAVQTSPVDLSTWRWKPMMSRMVGMVPISDRVQTSLQIECNTALKTNGDLLTAWFKSQSYQADPNYRIRHTRVWGEANRIGDKEFYPARVGLDSRTRCYDLQAALLTVQADFLSQSVLTSAQGYTMDKDAYFAVVAKAAPWLTETLLDEIDSVPLQDLIDAYGIKKVALLMDVRRFLATGMTHYLFSVDASTQGAGIMAQLAGQVFNMRLANLLGGEQQDTWGVIATIMQSFDDFMRNHAVHRQLRGTGKLLAKGGLYGAGAGTQTYQLLGLEPADAEKYADWGISDDSPKDWASKFSIPYGLYGHPMYDDLLSFDGTGGHKLRLGVDFQDIYNITELWTNAVGAKALHQAVPIIRPFIRAFRKINENHFESTGQLFNWKLRCGQEVIKVPWATHDTKTHKVETSVKGIRHSCTVSSLEYKTNRDVGVDYVHSADAEIRHDGVIALNNLGCDAILSNHDAVKVPAPFVHHVAPAYLQGHLNVGDARPSLAPLCRKFGAITPDRDHSWEKLKGMMQGACNMFVDEV